MIQQYTRKKFRTRKKVKTLTDRRCYVLVNKKNRPVFHEDGHVFLFYRRRDAESFLSEKLINFITEEDSDKYKIITVDTHWDIV